MEKKAVQKGSVLAGYNEILSFVLKNVCRDRYKEECEVTVAIKI